MVFQKTGCFDSPPPLALVLLGLAFVVAAFAFRLRHQGIVLHAAFVLVAPPEYVQAALLEMVVTGSLQLVLLAHACTMADLAPFHIRLGARALPPRGPGYAASSA